jgi:dTDP-4-dehydrorhamnose reductase
MRILVVGATGLLGSRVARQAADAGWTVIGTYFRDAARRRDILAAAETAATATERLDIRDSAAVAELIRSVRPDVVVNCAAGRDDWRVIADGAAYVALATAAQGARLIHVSSDALFSGRDVDYDESARPDPVYRYGAAKAAAETAVTAIAPAAAVVRTSLILGDGDGQHEILTRDLIAGRVRGALFTDMIRKPVHAADLAAALLELAAGDYRGILNVAGPEHINRYDLGLLIARRDGLDPARIPAATIAGSGLHLPTDVRLRTDRAVALLRTRLRGVHEFLSPGLSRHPAS